ncbi:alpha/beta hydrolase fold domain-containing protein [Bradyrhizobium sp. 2TAF24]|uniref:alpha/beta hydrolase fold domain-containing protein n=1 Tax=Bradyrhizobium sp. 2TAF24 TaxID=3233011 RepID=UPI003F91608F
MNDVTAISRPAEPDWSAITDADLEVYVAAENRFRASSAARAFLGEPDANVAIAWQEVVLPGRKQLVRVYRPAMINPGRSGHAPLPLVLHVHGGGFVGTAVQCDWANSSIAAGLPAVVVSVEHRLLHRDMPLSAAAADGWDVLHHLSQHAAEWGVDASRIAIFGESCGALIGALTALRARAAGLRCRAQVLVNPVADVTETMFAYPSMTRYAYSPSRAMPLLRWLQRLAVPPGADAREVSPIHAEDLGGLPPALVVVPTEDALADHGRDYAERLRAAGTSVRLTEYPGAQHAFLTLPGIEPQAEVARAEILEFLRASLG